MHVFAVFIGLLFMHAVILHDFSYFIFLHGLGVDVDGSPWLQQKKVRLCLLHGRAFFLCSTNFQQTRMRIYVILHCRCCNFYFSLLLTSTCFEPLMKQEVDSQFRKGKIIQVMCEFTTTKWHRHSDRAVNFTVKLSLPNSFFQLHCEMLFKVCN